MSRGKDFLDEMIEESTKKDPRFPELLAEAIARRELAKQLVAARTEKGLSQTMVAAAMRTAQSVVSKLEAGSDVRLSTMQRYCEVIGQSLVITLGPRKGAKKHRSTRRPSKRSAGRRAT